MGSTHTAEIKAHHQLSVALALGRYTQQSSFARTDARNKPPYFFMLSAMSAGLKVTARVEVAEEDDKTDVQRVVAPVSGIEHIGSALHP